MDKPTEIVLENLIKRVTTLENHLAWEIEAEKKEKSDPRIRRHFTKKYISFEIAEFEQKIIDNQHAMGRLEELAHKCTALMQFYELVEESGEVFVCIDVHDKLKGTQTYKGKTLAEAILKLPD